MARSSDPKGRETEKGIDELMDLLMLEHDFTGIGGWISPEGRFVHAEYCEHDLVAWRIARTLLPEGPEGDAGEYLEGLGWIRLETGGYVDHPFFPTQAQVTWIFWLFQHSRPGSYNHGIATVLDRIMTSLSPREVFPRVPTQGDQENMRKGVGYVREKRG